MVRQLSHTWHANRESKFNSKHPYSKSPPFITPVLKDPTLSSGPWAPSTHVKHIRCKTFKHKKIKLIYLKYFYKISWKFENLELHKLN